MRRLLASLCLCAGLASAEPQQIMQSLASSTLTATPSVALQADIVWASTAPGTVEPSLSAMRATLAQKVNYLSLKKLTSQQVKLDGKSHTLSLPNGTVASLSLEALKDSVATVRVKVPPTDASYTLAKAKSLYLQAGTHDGGDLWLVLSQPK